MIHKQLFGLQELSIWNYGNYLLYDFVHLLKNFRNLWLTERNSELEFDLDGETFLARWQDIRDLHKEEMKAGGIMKMSMLTEIAVYPKVIERQRVQPCLNVFCDKTAIALELYGEKHQTDVKGTVVLLQTVCKWWKILNVKQKGLDSRFKDPLQAVISNPNDTRL